MKKIFSYIFVFCIIFCLTSCYSKDSQNIANEINEETKTIARQCIYDKYGFYPEILFSSEQPKELSTYSFETFPSRDVLVTMKYRGKDFKTLVAGEYEYGKCYDNYQSEDLKEQLSKKFLNDLPTLKDLNPKITILGGKNPKLANNLINEKYEDNISKIIENEEPFYYVVEIASSTDILNNLDLGAINSKANVVILNYRDAKDVGLISQNIRLYNEDNIKDIDKYGLYLKEYLSVQNENTEYKKFDDIIMFNDYSIVGQINDISLNKEITNGMKTRKNLGGLKFETTSEKDLYIYIKKNLIVKNNEMLSNFIVLQDYDSHVNIERVFDMEDYIYFHLKPDKNSISFNIVKK